MTRHPFGPRKAILSLLTLACLAASSTATAAEPSLFLSNGSFDAPLAPPVDWMPLMYQSQAPVGWQNQASECEGFGSACGTLAFVTKAIADSPAPYGVQGEGLVVALYNQAALAQTFTVGAGQGGQYALNWQDAMGASINSLYQPSLLPVQNNPYRIVLDGVTLSEFSATSEVFSTQGVIVNLTEGQHELKIEGLLRPDTQSFGMNNQYTALTNTNVVLLDNMSISVVPEPGTLALSLLGLLGLTAVAGRRRRPAR